MPMHADDGASGGDSLAFTITSTIVDGIVHTVAHWKVLLLGQAVAIVLAIAGATNEVLSLECRVSAPSTYNAFGYCLVGIVGGFLLKRSERKRIKQGGADVEELKQIRNTENNEGDNDDGDGDDDEVDDDLTLEDDDSPRKRYSFFSTLRGSSNAKARSPDQGGRHGTDTRSHGSNSKHPQQYSFLFGLFTIHTKWYYYFGVAFIEAQAYYLIFLAFRYTTFTFVYVSDALAIPAAMIFTKLIMKRGYKWIHLLGGAVCIAGIVVNTVSDMSVKDGIDHVANYNHIKGDIFAIVGAVLLGLDDVLSEMIVCSDGGVTEMVFMKGVFGTLISIVQLVAFEMDSVQALFSSDEGSPCELSWRMVLFSTHIVTRALDVAGEMQFLYLSEAALLNLLLLTSDLYTAIFDVVRTGLHLSSSYFIAFFLILAGIVLYEAGPSPASQQSDTPLGIEIRQKKQKNALVPIESSDTEHTSNLIQPRELELT